MVLKKVSKKTGDEMPRSIWSTTGIFIALGVLTVLMALLMYGAIQGLGGGATLPDRTGPPMRATR